MRIVSYTQSKKGVEISEERANHAVLLVYAHVHAHTQCRQKHGEPRLSQHKKHRLLLRIPTRSQLSTTHTRGPLHAHAHDTHAHVTRAVPSCVLIEDVAEESDTVKIVVSVGVYSGA